MMDIEKSPRVFINEALSEGQSLHLNGAAHHYLKNVMRLNAGDAVRAFNGRDGEFSLRLRQMDKKSIEATAEQKLRPQENPGRRLHLLFAPLKKERMDFLIEKAVELGVTDLHPILTQNSDVRKINAERTRTQSIEAAEQCERMDIPRLHDMRELFPALSALGPVPVYAAIERAEAPLLSAISGDAALLIGPAGGWSDTERERLLSLPTLRPVSLGKTILRAETAAIAGLARITG
jgi:16S rRNA (uracil1498-N3)-methyltransferase